MPEKIDVVSSTSKALIIDRRLIHKTSIFLMVLRVVSSIDRRQSLSVVQTDGGCICLVVYSRYFSFSVSGRLNMVTEASLVIPTTYPYSLLLAAMCHKCQYFA